MTGHASNLKNVVMLLSVACAFFVFCLKSSAQTTTYSYTGQLFTYFEEAATCSPICGIGLSFVVPNPIPPDSEFIGSADLPSSSTFTDGYTVITNPDLSGTDNDLIVLTNGQGQIVNWAIVVAGACSPLTYDGLTCVGTTLFTEPGGGPDATQYYDGNNNEVGYANVANAAEGTWTCSPGCLATPTLRVVPNSNCGKTSCSGSPPQATCESSDSNPCSPNIVFADGVETSTLYVSVTPVESVTASLSLTPGVGIITKSVTTGSDGHATATYTAANYGLGSNSVGVDAIQGAIGSQGLQDLKTKMYDYAEFQFTQSQVSNETFTDSSDLSVANIQTFFGSVPAANGEDGDFLAHFYFDNNTANGGWYDPAANGNTMDTYNPKIKGVKAYCPTADACPATGDGGTSAASVISSIASASNINPKLLLVKLQKETSLISAAVMPSAKVLNKATGCKPSAFYSQLSCSAATFSTNYALDPTPNDPYFWPVNAGHVSYSVQFATSSSASCVDNKLATGCVLVGFPMNTAATFAQYKYTPFMQTTTSGGGVRLFEAIWAQYINAGWYQ
jgi:hypothetical protein